MGWNVIRWLLCRYVRRTSHRHLFNRTLQHTSAESMRGLPKDIDCFLETPQSETMEMRSTAKLPNLPNVGSRMMVELAIHTLAADAALRSHGVGTNNAHLVMADIGWDIYRRMLGLSSLPVRIISRDPALRQSWCRYDSPGADIIAADGQRGHYRRPRTLSAGDPVFDMCWKARGSGQMLQSQEEEEKQC